MSTGGSILVSAEAGATDVVVDNRRLVRGGCGPFGFEVVLQDRVDGGEGARADLQRPTACRLQPLAAKTFDQPDDADRGAEALFGVRALAHDDLNQCSAIGSDLAGLPSDPLWCPVGIATVAAWHVLAHCGVLPVR